MAASGRLRRSPSIASLYQLSPDSPVRWTWASMKPGRSVASPRSITSAPAGTERPAPTALIVDPSTITTAPATVPSPLPSKSRAALRTVRVGGAGVGLGACAWTVDAATKATAVSSSSRMLLGLQGRRDIL
jgi:hypothetical protein